MALRQLSHVLGAVIDTLDEDEDVGVNLDPTLDVDGDVRLTHR
jgi:hypothetical protein